MRKIYSLWFISLLFLVLGFILNSIKGLLILQATFLDFQNGQFVTRTDYSTIPPFLPEGVQLTVITLVFLLSAFICFLERLYERKNSIQKVSTPKLAKV